MHKITSIPLLLLLSGASIIFSISAKFKENPEYEHCLGLCKIRNIEKPLTNRERQCVILGCRTSLQYFDTYLKDKLNAEKNENLKKLKNK